MTIRHPETQIVPAEQHSPKMPGAEGTPQTLYDKVLQAHVVDEKLDGTVLLYIGKCTTLVFLCLTDPCRRLD